METITLNISCCDHNSKNSYNQVFKRTFLYFLLALAVPMTQSFTCKENKQNITCESETSPRNYCCWESFSAPFSYTSSFNFITKSTLSPGSHHMINRLMSSSQQKKSHWRTTDATNLAGKPQGVECFPKAVWLRGDVHKHQAVTRNQKYS